MVAVVSLQITAALPLSQMSVNRVTRPGRTRRRQRGGNLDSLAGVQHLAELDIDARKLDGRWCGEVEGGRDVAERRQHLRCIVRQITQLTGVHRIRAGAQSQLVELHIGTGPREFDGR